ncbi:hypothetical protein KGF56_004237 [Candida oxycetoniae]|uniref:Trafficking protein particle complex III-specific subunit 85 n=1 Tax=Candida oxycetoniae TaxID=497107 RepID=A0AAI9SUY5_9ASCO|nr:uncharacterized protein KGF56_004237 [Candida oxycetoniae]KAI3402984.2 hypothetical protein KGF56_004237 [Candida oxycetoniae]
MDYPKGLDPFTARQHLLHHVFSPLISLQSTHNVDICLESILNNNHSLSTLQIFKPFGNNAKYSIHNQQFRITNTQLITKTYTSFPIRFEPPLSELLSISNAQQRKTFTGQKTIRISNNNETSRLPLPPPATAATTTATAAATAVTESSSLDQLFSISSLELYLQHLANQETDNLYLTFFDKIITTNKLIPFETFNHPISQIFVIDFENDTIEELRKSIVEFRNYNFPKFFQIDDLFIHVFIMFDSTKFKANQVMVLVNEIKAKLTINCTLIPINKDSNNGKFVSISAIENCTIEEDLQRMTLNDATESFDIPESLDIAIREAIYEYINKFLIPHMQAKIRSWDDQMLQPRKSITNRFFSASKKLFNNSDSNLLSSTPLHSSSSPNSSSNYTGSYYHKSTPEQIIRKLADWSLILKDFKYAYSTYDLVKKDYTNDRAWIYVASTQEMCIVSLLLTQTQQIPNPSLRPQQPDKNTLRKIRHDIIEPFMDNLSYTFKSRLNLKTYSFKSFLMVIELLLSMCQMYNIAWWWQDLIEKYLLLLVTDFNQHLTAALPTSNFSVIKAILLERLGYSNGHYFEFTADNSFLLNREKMVKVSGGGGEEEEEEENENENEKESYINPFKLANIKPTVGLTRLRKSALWYLLSLKEWKVANCTTSKQYETLLQNVEFLYDFQEDGRGASNGNEWYNRKDTLFSIIKDK